MADAPAALAAISDAVVGIVGDLSLDTVLARLVHAARDLVDARYVALDTPDDDGGFDRFISAGMTYAVPSATAELVNEARSAGHRIVAVGTTATRAIESAPTRTAPSTPARGGPTSPSAPIGGACGRRHPQRLARARGVAPAHARGGGGPLPAGAQLRPRSDRPLPLARVRRFPLVLP